MNNKAVSVCGRRGRSRKASNRNYSSYFAVREYPGLLFV
jgi:hypothetical protein